MSNQEDDTEVLQRQFDESYVFGHRLTLTPGRYVIGGYLRMHGTYTIRDCHFQIVGCGHIDVAAYQSCDSELTGNWFDGDVRIQWNHPVGQEPVK